MLSVSDQGAAAPCPAPFNLAAHVLARAPALGEKPALEIPGTESWSYARMESAVRGCGTGLLALGLVPGDRVLMRLGNGVAFPILYLAAIAVGLVPVPTSAQLTGPEITRMAAQIGPALIVADEGVAVPPGRILPARDLLAMAALTPCDYAMGDPDRLAYIIFTSGTSGRPQAVCHAHRAIWARQRMIAGWEALGPDDRLLHAGAFNWTYTLGTGLMDPWTAGATALIPGPGVPAADLAGLLVRHDATIFAAAPGVYRQMLKQALPPLPRLRHGLSAGEALAPDLRARWRDATGTDLHEAFGLSECSTFVSGAPARPAPEGATGYAQPGRRIAVLGPGGAPVPRGEAGILAVDRRDPGVFLGYLDDPAATAGRFAGDWFTTGDAAQMEADGAIRYLGRDDDMMNAGGFRVSPLEVETALQAFPGLTELAVTEVEVKPGATVIACFYIAPQPVDTQALSDFATGCLARYKQPRIYVALPALPRGPNNKLSRRALKALRPEKEIP
jgi:acyl-coenzyme A synthetase/AMP-(fatty) acid ligase